MDARKVITIAHPEQSSGELKKKNKVKDIINEILVIFKSFYELSQMTFDLSDYRNKQHNIQ